MNVGRKLPALLVAAASVLAVTGAGAAQPEPGALPVADKFRLVEFGELSDPHVSRLGNTALQMTSVVWQHAETDHFIFHFERGFLCQQFAIAAELFYDRIKTHLGVADDAYERKAQVFVFLGADSWRVFSRQINLEQWTGAFNSGNELFVTGRANQTVDRSSQVPHEITHLIVKRFVGDLPLWLNEGVAEFEGSRQRWLYLRQRVATKQFVMTYPSLPPAQFIPLVELTGRTDYPANDAEVRAFYAESELLVHYLYDECGGSAAFLKFLKLQSQGQRFATSFTEVYGGKFRDGPALEAAFTKFATRQDQ